MAFVDRVTGALAPDYELVALVFEEEGHDPVGVLVNALTGKATNRFEDGTVGVSQYCQWVAEDQEVAYSPKGRAFYWADSLPSVENDALGQMGFPRRRDALQAAVLE